jgi:hypothetical protein
MLEKVFGAEINGTLFTTESKIAKKLEADGFIVLDEKIICKDRFGTVTVKGYRTTLKGNAEYCMSERCA